MSAANALAVTWLNDKHDTDTRRQSNTPWCELVERLSAHDRRSTKEGPAWSAAIFSGSRSKENVVSVGALVLDVDKLADVDVDAVEARLRKLGLDAVAHTSFSDEPGGERAWRVAIRLTRPVAAAEWPAFWLAAVQHISIPVGQQSKDESRLWYLPACPPAANPIAWTFDGKALDVDAVLAEHAGILAAEKALREAARPTERPNSSRNRAPVEERAERYVDQMPAAVSGQEGSVATFKVAAVLVRGFALSQEVARPILERYSQRCDPPWTEFELDHKLEGAAKADLPLGWLLDNDSSRLPPRRETPVEDSYIDGSSEDWPPPRPVGSELRSVTRFDSSLLPESLRPWVLDIAHRMQCPIDFVAVPAMVMLSSAIGRRIQICPKQNDPWQLPANLWGGTVGRPGANKSAPTAAALEPLRTLQADKLREFQDSKQKHEFEQTVAKERLSLRDGEIKKALKRGANASDLEALRQEHADDSDPPRALRLEINDTTTAKLGETLAQNKFGVLMYRDELVGFLSQLDRTGAEGDRQFYLECWNGNGRFIVDRIARGTTWVEGLCVSVIGTLQPGPLEGYLQGAMSRGAGADGFIQRFQLLVYPDPVPEWKFIDATPDRVASERVCKVVADLVSLGDMIERNCDGQPKIVRFTSDAQVTYAEWLTDLHRERIDDPDELSAMVSHLSKYASLVPKLALILETCDALAAGRNLEAVDTPSLARAIMWAEYLESHARRIYELVETGDENAAKQLLSKIREGKLGDRFTRREVARKRWAGLREAATIDSAILVLEEHDWLRCRLVPSPTNGREFEHVLVNPQALAGGQE